MMNSETTEQPTITKEAIDAYKQQRAKECGEKLAALLAEYDCDLMAVPQIVDGRIVAVVALVAK